MKQTEKLGSLVISEVRNKEEVIEEAQTKGNTVHVASLVDLCHLKFSELHEYKGRVVQLGDVVKGDSGFCAVFTEQCSSAFHLTAAKVLCEISRLPGCASEGTCVNRHSSNNVR